MFLNNQNHIFNIMEIDISKVNIQEVRDEANLILYNSPLCSIKVLKLSNEIINKLKNGEIKVNFV